MTPNILANQMRSARAWLNWSRDDLAEKAGVVANTIAAIEKGDGSSEPNARTLAKIMGAFEAAGIEMTDEGGVRPRMNRVEYYTGMDGFRRFFDDIYDVVKHHAEPDVCIANVDEILFAKWLADYEPVHIARMATLNPPRYKVLVKQNDLNLRSSAYSEFRWVDADHFADVCIYLYGDKSAFIEFGTDSVSVTSVDNPSVSRSLRRMFGSAWNEAHPIGGDS